MAIIGVVADDFTGTASAGVFVAKSQARTGLFFDKEAVNDFRNTDELDAIYVSSNSRHLKPDLAYKEVAETTAALKKMGVKYLSKKIDTTLRGGIGYEIDAMMDLAGKDTMAIVVTAMPQSKRICIGGYSLIDGTILEETPIAQDVRSPITESYIPHLLQKQTKRNVTLITITEVLRGVDSLKRALSIAKEEGNKIIIIDAITMDHIDVIAQACTELSWDVLAVDPGPFTMKLAYHRGVIKEEAPSRPHENTIDSERTALFVVGSANPLTKTQMNYLCNHDGRNIKISVSPTKLVKGGETMKAEVERATSAIIDAFNSPDKARVILVETALSGTILDLKAEDQKNNYEEGTGSRLINQGLAEITKNVLSTVEQEKIAGLMLTGGDTMESVCRAIGVECIEAIDNIVSQIDVGKIIGKYDKLPLIVKGGFCGYEEVAVDIVERLFSESTKG